MNVIDTIKLLLCKEHPELLEKLDFDDDAVFLEPFLFAYFNSKKENRFPIAMLTELLQGYFTEKQPLFLNESLNKDGIAYVPNLGYFNKLGYKVDEILKIDKFEILKTCHPLLEKYFYEFYKGHIVNANPIHNTVWEENYKELEQAILIIKQYLPEFYKELVFANKRIYLHDNPKILNFTSIETMGMLYFYVLGKNNLIYFIEEIIHQASHNYLYYIMFNKNDFFKIDSLTTIMRDLTKQDWDYRNLYGAYHGLYTVTKRVECFDILLSKNVFSGREKHELLGRMTDMFPRFQTGLELLDLNKVYTEKGKNLYCELTEKCQSMLLKYSKLISEFDLSHRDLDFRYEEFCIKNSYEDFLKKDLEGYYNF
jgi:hypothetical protein